MGDHTRAYTEDMATTSTAVTTVATPLSEEVDGRTPVAVITLRRRDPRKRVVWTDDTVDNEHMNKKKSKCCCIYTKPRKLDESSSESDDDEGEHCFGHVERKHRAHHPHCEMHAGTSAPTLEQSAEPSTEVTLKPEPAPAPPDKQEPVPSV